MTHSIVFSKKLANLEPEECQVYESPSIIKDPKISVILSTYNRFRAEGDCPCLLHRAIKSILNQTFSRFELILVDDASIDGTSKYCQQIVSKDPRVRFFHFQTNSGIPARRYNFGISVSRSPYIAFMFDDDAWEMNALQDLYSAIRMRSESYGMVYGLAVYYDWDRFWKLGGRWGWNRIDSSNFISNNAVLVKRCVIDQVGGYDEDPLFLRICDWDLWWRIGRKYRVGRIKKKVARVYANLPDSIGVTKSLNWAACRKKQREKRVLPLQKEGKAPLRCRIQSLLFDLYVTICQRDRIKRILRKYFPRSKLQKIAKKVLPQNLYLYLKQMRDALQQKMD